MQNQWRGRLKNFGTRVLVLGHRRNEEYQPVSVYFTYLCQVLLGASLG